MTVQDRIEQFLVGKHFAVVGASGNRSKYGNKVFRVYLQNGIDAVPIHPTAVEIEGHAAYASLSVAPGPIDGVSIITPPHVTEQVVREALDLGIKNFWMQPGAESAVAIELAAAEGANVIAGGPCILVTLRYRDEEA